MEDKEKNILELLKAFPKTEQYIYGYKSSSRKEDLESKDFLGFTSSCWVVGGKTGGSCWGTEANSSVSAESPEEINDLDAFLEAHFPETTFLQYKKILSRVKQEEYTVYEYYGNYTEYKIAYIKFEDIVDCLENDSIAPQKIKKNKP